MRWYLGCMALTCLMSISATAADLAISYETTGPNERKVAQTTYIKGKLRRVESVGSDGRGTDESKTFIINCDTGETFDLHVGLKSFRRGQLAGPYPGMLSESIPRDAEDVSKGEERVFWGHRSLKLRVKSSTRTDSDIVVEGWFIDLEVQDGCPSGTRYSLPSTRTRTLQHLLPVDVTTTSQTATNGMRRETSHRFVVKQLKYADLDPALFEPPRDFKPTTTPQ